MEGNILQKIKKHGIAGSIQVVGLHAATAFNNKWFYYYKKHRPMDEHLIVHSLCMTICDITII